MLKLKKMWDYAIRFKFGPQLPPGGDAPTEGATSANENLFTVPTRQVITTTTEPTTMAMANDFVSGPPSSPSALNTLHDIIDIQRLSLENTEPAQNNTHSHIATHSLTVIAEPTAESQTEAAGIEDMELSYPSPGTPTASTAAVANTYGLPTYPDYDAIAADILLPVAVPLKKLAETTVAHMPPPGLKAKSHMQLVKERLLPIGEFIVAYINGLEQRQRGAMEMRLW